MSVWLRLKLLADVGLLGLPNAGKSTFLNAVTNARAKTGAYPFTTLRPQLGVARHHGRELVLADIPGLIAGASDGVGIGDRFLGHIERCRVLLHLLDAGAEDVLANYRTVRTELLRYGEAVADKPEILVLAKADTADAAQIADAAEVLAAECGVRPLVMSALTGVGVDTVLDRIFTVAAPEEAATTGEWSPL
jgi:GTP-binding protein